MLHERALPPNAGGSQESSSAVRRERENPSVAIRFGDAEQLGWDEDADIEWDVGDDLRAECEFGGARASAGTQVASQTSQLLAKRGTDGQLPPVTGRRRRDSWEPPLSIARRVRRAASTPQLAGVVVFLVALCIALVVVWGQSHSAEIDGDGFSAEQAVDLSETPDAGDVARATESSNDGSDAKSPESHVFVHVVGAVAAPGVVELPASSRVRDAVAQAGGATAEAVLAGVNLARTVVDGEQIFVPDAAAIAAGVQTGSGADGLAGAAGVPGQPAGVIDLNTADQAALETLPRVGPTLAQRILEWRAMNGRFTSVDQLLDVPGIGSKTLDGFRDQVGVS